MDDSNFILLAEVVLSTLCEDVSHRYGAFADADFDDGVLTIQLPAEETYVINRHIPSQQIWLSSPVSGPSYYAYDDSVGLWRHSKNPSQTLTQILLEELAHIQKDQACGGSS